MADKDYVIGAGKVYFDLFVEDTETPTGERYIGSTPSFSVSSTYNDLPHYSSEGGTREMDDNFTLQTDRIVTFSSDNVSMENVGIMWGSSPTDETTAAATGETETITDVKLGLYYQLGVSALVPDGVGTVSNVSITIESTAVTAAGNYEVDTANGRIYVLPTATDITAGDDLAVTYDTVLQTRTVVVEAGTQIEGALRFIADNLKGPNKNYYWPRVRLQPTGDFALKGETWQTMTFQGAVLAPSDGRERVYVRQDKSA